MTNASPSHSLDSQTSAALAPASATAQNFAEYCYMFPELANGDGNSLLVNPDTKRIDETYTRAILRELASNLAIHPEEDQKQKTLPAVYTYFGQFLNHDISAPIHNTRAGHVDMPPPGVLDMGHELIKNSLLGPRPVNIKPILNTVLNQHIEPMMLESLYGGGPFGGTPEVKCFYETDLPVFKLGKTVRSSTEELRASLAFPERVVPAVATQYPDLLRNVAERRPLIPDPRNDENLLIGQLHLAFMLFHNQAVKKLSAKFPDKVELFKNARKHVILHYQYCVIHDYLESILSRGSVSFSLKAPSQLKHRNKVPMEFSTAAFRFGHSMVSDGYNFNANFSLDGPQAPEGKLASLQQLFQFTSRGGICHLPDHWVADWTRLTDANGPVKGRSEPIDPFISSDMLNQGAPTVPDDLLKFTSIITRNILRGFYRRIPSGQCIAKHINPPVEILTKQQISNCLNAISMGKTKDAICENTPAWLYFLCEAQVLGQGTRLGPLASYIIAGTIIGLLKLNDDSCIGKNNTAWSPDTSPLKNTDDTPIKDIKGFLRFAGVMP
jgi:Animal haem peroxidase